MDDKEERQCDPIGFRLTWVIIGAIFGATLTYSIMTAVMR